MNPFLAQLIIGVVTSPTVQASVVRLLENIASDLRHHAKDPAAVLKHADVIEGWSWHLASAVLANAPHKDPV